MNEGARRSARCRPGRMASRLCRGRVSTEGCSPMRRAGRRALVLLVVVTVPAALLHAPAGAAASAEMAAHASNTGGAASVPASLNRTASRAAGRLLQGREEDEGRQQAKHTGMAHSGRARAVAAGCCGVLAAILLIAMLRARPEERRRKQTLRQIRGHDIVRARPRSSRLGRTRHALEARKGRNINRRSAHGSRCRPLGHGTRKNGDLEVRKSLHGLCKNLPLRA